MRSDVSRRGDLERLALARNINRNRRQHDSKIRRVRFIGGDDASATIIRQPGIADRNNKSPRVVGRGDDDLLADDDGVGKHDGHLIMDLEGFVVGLLAESAAVSTEGELEAAEPLFVFDEGPDIPAWSFAFGADNEGVGLCLVEGGEA